jgi:ligand-binding sensor domain-containing protein
VTLIDGRGVAIRLPSGAVLPAGGATAVAWGAGGRLYVATPGGLAVVADGQVVARPLDGPVAALALGAEGMYAAAPGGLVLVAPDGKVERLGPAGATPTVNAGALALEATPAGERLYAGTQASGLLVYERSTRAWYTVRAPLPSDNVTSVAVAREAIWLGTDAGLVRIDRATLEGALAPPARS